MDLRRPPGIGSTFKGRDSIPDVFNWETDCIVTTWEERTVFEWRVTDTENPGAIWRFDVAEQGGGSRLRFSMLIMTDHSQPPVESAALRDPAKEQRMRNRHREILRANMQRVVDSIKAIIDES